MLSLQRYQPATSMLGVGEYRPLTTKPGTNRSFTSSVLSASPLNESCGVTVLIDIDFSCSMAMPATKPAPTDS